MRIIDLETLESRLMEEFPTCMSLVVDGETIWAGTYGNGLFKVDNYMSEKPDITVFSEADGLADTPLGRCSGGELQRVLLALALEPAPDLLVLDEPVSGIDRNGLKMFLDTLIDLRRTRHMAILLVSHDLRFVREYADHVVLLEKNVLTQGTPGEVFASREFAAVFGTGEEEEDA